MTPKIYEQLVNSLRRKHLPLAQLHAYATDAGSTWSLEQMHLMFDCMAGVEVEITNGERFVRLGEPSEQEELIEAITEILQAQGRPIPAAQVLMLLPKKFTTSVEQIKKVAKEATGLKVLGPGLIALEG